MLEERFFAKVKKTRGCWLWLGAMTSNGYGSLGIEGRSVSAHKASLLMHGVEVPLGMCIMHICDNKLCVNPKHLVVGTQQENVDDMVNKGRSATGSRNGKAKLNEVQVLEIRAKYKPHKYSRVRLAEEYGVDLCTIGGIIDRRYWTHI